MVRSSTRLLRGLIYPPNLNHDPRRGEGTDDRVATGKLSGDGDARNNCPCATTYDEEVLFAGGGGWKVDANTTPGRLKLPGEGEGG